jgi:phosphoglycolate phosphatase
MIKGILFDKDGTLLDFNGTWLEPYLQASRYLADCVGDPTLADRLMRNGGYIEKTGGWQCDSLLASGSNEQIYEFWSAEMGGLMTSAQIARVQEIFSHASSSYVPAVENIGKILQALKLQGMKLGLATMDDELNARGMLQQLHITDYFDFICGADSGYGVKPEAGMINGFCAVCDLVPAEVLMVGDSPKDLNMGKNAGAALSVGVLTGAHSREELQMIGDVVIENISGLEALIQANTIS